MTITYGTPDRNRVGGAVATETGGGDDLRYQAQTGGIVQDGGSVAAMLGGGDDMRIVYAPAAPEATVVADRGRD